MMSQGHIWKDANKSAHSRASASSGGIGGASGLASAVPGTLNQTVESLSTNIDDKTMHELYLWPFADAIHAGSASVMCSYQRINNSYGCHNQKAQNGLLKTELGFEGFVVSDWGAQRKRFNQNYFKDNFHR